MHDSTIRFFACLWTLVFAMAGNADTLRSATSIVVREFRFEGNTVFSSQQLSKLLAGYLGHEISSDELEQARRDLTVLYVRAGYINSGAVLEDQPVRDGVITFKIIEGVLSNVQLKGNRHLCPGYLIDRVKAHAGQPLNMESLKEGLLLLRQNPNIAQVNAELKPSPVTGQGDLELSVKENNPFRAGLQVDNYRPPSVGAEEFVLTAADYNLTGHSDLLEATYGIAHDGEDGFEFSGLDNIGGSYTLPVTARETTIRVFGNRSDSSVIEEPFNNLDITSRLIRYGGTLRQPVTLTANREVALGVTFERGESETFLLGQPFDVSPGSVHGRIYTSVLRLTQEWLERSQSHALAIRSTVNVGVDVFGTTDNGTDRDATFVSWLGQVQYLQRLFNTPNLLVLRVNGQWTDEPLLSLEQFSVGGANSVRGYRENQLVRDRGFFSSVEGRIPVWSDRSGRAIVQLAPFFDIGGAWNVAAGTPPPSVISSVGIGILIDPNPHVHAQLYWGHPLETVPNPNNNAQDLGLHFKVSFEAF